MPNPFDIFSEDLRVANCAYFQMWFDNSITGAEYELSRGDLRQAEIFVLRARAYNMALRGLVSRIKRGDASA